LRRRKRAGTSWRDPGPKQDAQEVGWSPDQGGSGSWEGPRPLRAVGRPDMEWMAAVIRVVVTRRPPRSLCLVC
jgi:hypothetical protein